METPLANTLRRGQYLELRPEVIAFARLMEAKLRENDYKGGRHNDTPEALWPRVLEELGEVRDALNPFTFNGEGRDNALAASEAADVANFLMMITDLLGELT